MCGRVYQFDYIDPITWYRVGLTTAKVFKKIWFVVASTISTKFVNSLLFALFQNNYCVLESFLVLLKKIFYVFWEYWLMMTLLIKSDQVLWRIQIVLWRIQIFCAWCKTVLLLCFGRDLGSFICNSLLCWI